MQRAAWVLMVGLGAGSCCPGGCDEDALTLAIEGVAGVPLQARSVVFTVDGGPAQDAACVEDSGCTRWVLPVRREGVVQAVVTARGDTRVFQEEVVFPDRVPGVCCSGVLAAERTVTFDDVVVDADTARP